MPGRDGLSLDTPGGRLDGVVFYVRGIAKAGVPPA